MTRSQPSRRTSWRGRAVGGAVLLTCLSAGVAQAVSTVHPAAGAVLASGVGTAFGSPTDTSDLAGGGSSEGTPSPLTTEPAVGPGSHAARGPHHTTVITQNTKQRLAAVSDITKYDIPQAALLAYKRAAIVIDKTAPDCNLSWPILAGIGQVESDQGRYGGSHVLADGSTVPHIVGIPLNGAGGVARIPDTDNGRWDSDTVWDRAVGPMQFIPSTWAVVGVDADNDGVRDPSDFDDAALAAAVYLCANDRDLSTSAGAHAAVFSYNHSDEYVSLVLSLARGYANGDVTVVPNDTQPPSGGGGDDGTGGDGTPGDGHGHGHGQHHPGTDPDPGGGSHHGHGQGTDPGGPTAPPDPPEPTATTLLVGFVAPCEKDATQWCLGDATLNFGDDADLTQVQADYDGDGTAEPVADELAGLVGTRIHAKIDDDNDNVVLTLQGLEYAVIPLDPTDPTPTNPTPTDPTPTDPAPTDPAATGPTSTGPTATPQP